MIGDPGGSAGHPIRDIASTDPPRPPERRPAASPVTGLAGDGPFLSRLVEIVRAGGAAAMAHYGEPPAADRKADGSPVTRADLDAHRVLVERIGAWLPAVPIISEEGERPPFEARRDWPAFWLIDPLDGTKEFLNRNGEFTVNVALIEAGRPILGAVYAPARELCYVAAEGLGAWRAESDGRLARIRSHAPEPGRGLVVVESRSHPSAELERYLQTLPVAGRVQVGSSLKFCLVADGSADLYPRFGPTMEWDVAAGDCVWRNSAPDGRTNPSPLTYNKPDLRNGSFVIGWSPRT
jgi:3'(2'), 5'-bisphosphate nucleotidase